MTKHEVCSTDFVSEPHREHDVTVCFWLGKKGILRARDGVTVFRRAILAKGVPRAAPSSPIHWLQGNPPVRATKHGKAQIWGQNVEPEPMRTPLAIRMQYTLHVTRKEFMYII